uniref:Uncharacterized protein n=1 Tax=Glossina austeni TaxID=7395 RepID=A0A1A9UEK2_GLOAU
MNGEPFVNEVILTLLIAVCLCIQIATAGSCDYDCILGSPRRVCEDKQKELKQNQILEQKFQGFKLVPNSIANRFSEIFFQRPTNVKVDLDTPLKVSLSRKTSQWANEANQVNRPRQEW